MMGILLQINGLAHKVAADPSTPLICVLRNEFGLVGAIANAIYDAVGLRLRRTPFNAEAIRAATMA